MAFAKGKTFVLNSGFCPTCAEPREKDKIWGPYNRVKSTEKSLSTIAAGDDAAKAEAKAEGEAQAKGNRHADAAKQLFSNDRESFNAIKAYTNEKVSLARSFNNQSPRVGHSMSRRSHTDRISDRRRSSSWSATSPQRSGNR
jgi:hypothetical protein